MAQSPNVAVDLYDANKAKVATVVVVGTSMPPLISYLGNYYVWQHPITAYQVATPFAASLDAGSPRASITADPPPAQL